MARLLLLSAFGCAFGCLKQLAVNQTAEIIIEGAPALEEEGDFEYAAQAVPGSLLTLEALWRVAPDNEDLLLQLASGYAGYALLFLEDEMEQAPPDSEEYYRRERRAARFFLRARRYGARLAEEQNEGFKEALQEGLPSLEAYLAERDEDDVPALFWTAYGWGAAIGHSLDNVELVADFPLVVAILERVCELDPGYMEWAPLTFQATVYSSFSEAMGGNPEKGRELFQRAFRLQERKDLLALVQYAKSYCVSTQNRSEFRRILREVLDAPDYRKHRLVNVAAKRRARRLLAREEELFYE